MVSVPRPPILRLFRYAPVVSLPVGVISGATVTSVTPVSGAIGSTGLIVRVQGTRLASNEHGL